MLYYVKDLLLSQSEWAKDLGIFIIRFGLGAVFIKHGFGKILQGPQGWAWMGSQMSLLGITVLPLFWGICAVASEFIGGCALVLGIYTRVAVFFLALVMLVALLFHLNNNDPFKAWSHPLSLLIVFIGLFLAGSGKFSVDYLLQ